MSTPSFFLRMKSLSERHIDYNHFLRITGITPPRHKDYSMLNSFIDKNRRMFEFMGIDADVIGKKHEFEIGLSSSKYIGVIPTLLPNGRQGGDICIYPNIGKNLFEDEANDEEKNSGIDSKGSFSKLYDLIKMMKAEYLIESIDSIPLKNGMDVCPPMYLEAAKYIDLFSAATKENWRKFGRERRTYNFAKSSTNWSEYAKRSYDPSSRLVFLANDNILSVDHKEWRQLRYVFELAADIIRNPATPIGIRVRYENEINSLDKLSKQIKPETTQHIEIHVSDPLRIRLLKEQARRILNSRSTLCVAWRIDIATLFERYVQYVLKEAFRKYGGTVVSNQKFVGTGDIPKWGLKYLEPDILIKLENGDVIVCDAKYKANMFVMGESEKIHETHRHDLHQVIAYSAFSPETNKTVILAYPSNVVSMEEFAYESSFTGIKNSVYLMGIPFDTKDIEGTISVVTKELSLRGIFGEDNNSSTFNDLEELENINGNTDEGIKDEKNSRSPLKISFNGVQYSMRKLALVIVEDYVKKNPSITYDELINSFNIVLEFNNKPLIQLASSVSESEKKSNRVYWKSPIKLADNNIVVVNTQWQRIDWDKFIYIANELGYEVDI